MQKRKKFLATALTTLLLTLPIGFSGNNNEINEKPAAQQQEENYAEKAWSGIKNSSLLKDAEAHTSAAWGISIGYSNGWLNYRSYNTWGVPGYVIPGGIIVHPWPAPNWNYGWFNNWYYPTYSSFVYYNWRGPGLYGNRNLNKRPDYEKRYTKEDVDKAYEDGRRDEKIEYLEKRVKELERRLDGKEDNNYIYNRKEMRKMLTPKTDMNFKKWESTTYRKNLR